MEKGTLWERDEKRRDIFFGIWLLVFILWLPLSLTSHLARFIAPAFDRYPMNIVFYIPVWLIVSGGAGFLFRALIKRLRKKDEKKRKVL